MPTRALSPALDALEGRRLLSGLPHAPTPAALVERAEARAEQDAAMGKLETDFRKMTADMRLMEAASQVTPAEMNALARDLHLLEALDSAQGNALAPTPTVQDAQRVASDLAWSLAYSFTEAYFTPKQWANKEAALQTDLAEAGVPAPAPVMNQLMTDLEAIALSADVPPRLHNQFTADVQAVYKDRDAVADPPLSLDPLNYFGHHLAGFVPGHRAGNLTINLDQTA